MKKFLVGVLAVGVIVGAGVAVKKSEVAGQKVLPKFFVNKEIIKVAGQKVLPTVFFVK